MRVGLLLWEKRNRILSLVTLGIGLVITGTSLAISAAPLTRRGALKVPSKQEPFPITPHPIPIWTATTPPFSL